MRTISLLATVLAVYCGVVLLAAWSITSLTRHTAAPSGPAFVASEATVAGSTLHRSKPVTRWDRPARSHEPTYTYHDGADDEDYAPMTVITAQRVDPKPRSSTGLNCFVGYDAMKKKKKAARL